MVRRFRRWNTSGAQYFRVITALTWITFLQAKHIGRRGWVVRDAITLLFDEMHPCASMIIQHARSSVVGLRGANLLSFSLVFNNVLNKKLKLIQPHNINRRVSSFRNISRGYHVVS